MVSNFGDETEYGTWGTVNDYLRGIKATCPEAGTGISIKAFVKRTDGTSPASKCALYKVSDDSLVDSTEEKEITTDAGYWETYNFLGSPSLTNIDYYIVLWGSDADKQVSNAFASGQSGKTMVSQSLVYGEWPNPSDLNEAADYSRSIYCTYTPSGVGVTVKTGSIVPLAMTSLFSLARRRFPTCPILRLT